MSGRRSGYAEHPDYRVELEPKPGRVCARVGGVLVADSERALSVRETRHAPVVQFPRDDVRMDLLERTHHVTFCPFEGEASYWTLRLADRALENAVWSYEDPFEEVRELKDYLSFYPDRVDLEEG